MPELPGLKPDCELSPDSPGPEADVPSESATMDGMDEVLWWYWLVSWLPGWGGKAQVMFYEG